MDILLDHITQVKEEELGVKEFQVVVLSALLNIMKEQESLNRTLHQLTTEKQNSNGHFQEHLNIFTDDESSGDEMPIKSKQETILYFSIFLGDMI